MIPFAFMRRASSIFDPATLNPTGWWRASYTSPPPWVGQAGGNLTQTTGSQQPATGAAVDTFTPADHDGTDDHFSGADFNTFVSAAAGTVLVAFLSDTAPAAAANTYDDSPLVTDTNNAFSLAFSDGGVGIAFYDGTAWRQQRVACTSGAYHLAKCRWDGSNAEVGRDGVAMTSIAAGNLALSAGFATKVGQTQIASIKYFDGRILEVFFKNTKLTDAQIADYYSYLKARYPSAGFP